MRHFVLIFGFAMGAAASECTAVTGPSILGRDLKAAAPALHVDDGAVIANSPVPGVNRVLTKRELLRFGGSDQDLCFRRAGRPLDPGKIRDAMERVFADRKVEITVVDYVRASLPDGVLEFTLPGLSRAEAKGAAMWRGRLRYDDRSTAAVWATVIVTEERTWVEAAKRIEAGEIVDTSALKRVKGVVSPVAERRLEDEVNRGSIDGVSGAITLPRISAVNR